MPSFPVEPLVRPRDDGLQLCYRLPHRIHAAQAYPLRSPNGSSIIVYGYETGLKIVWRGGREFSALKEAAPSTQAKSAKNDGDDAVMIIDSDEEDAPAAPTSQEEPTYDFATEESEVDPAFPFEPILRQIDIPLGSRVLDVAVPRVLPEEARSPLDPFPTVAKDTIFVAAVCSDLSTRVVTLPLMPPHPAQKDSKSWKIQKVTLNGGVTHQDIPRGVSLTFSCQESEDEQDRRKSRSRVEGSGRWDLLVATHSAEGSGALLIHRVPLSEESSGKDVLYRLVEEELVSQRRTLPSPAQTIAFNPSSYPSARHSSLLVAFHSGCVKVYSCFSVQKAVSKTGRRGSNAQDEYETIDMEGRWLISLYPGFEQGPTGLTRRKTIIDADWVLGGRAIMVLLADGEWGVWDIEGAGPGTTKGPLHRQSNVQGVTGGSLTTYAVSGRIVAPLGNTQSDAEQRSRFAPMTPSTRRVREDTLLKGSTTAPSPSLRGQISVCQTNVSHELPDESILLRHGQHSAVIPSLLSLWRNAVKTTGTFDASNRCRVTPFQVVNLMGENFQAIGHLPAPARRSRAAESQKFDILVAAEHQIVILAPRLTESEDIAATTQVAKQEVDAEADQMMLRRGELDVEGMGRLLNGMASGAGSLRVGGSPVKRARIFT
ncbi:uncharacterized protein N7496_005225 [Penicillium cataractarum]|uniref:Nucleoporin NUP37 n=1 Tax=Penicillium cataractarum TaxID=2100454 RepID=A0A9W9VFU3_9EURO|nr:uncharacterized protein N7496_005225 [Penicillium cataractarum]KAJ5377816.1 hypothetical protein N7496_005225 [Penicillium cataractarum]